MCSILLSLGRCTTTVRLTVRLTVWNVVPTSSTIGLEPGGDVPLTPVFTVSAFLPGQTKPDLGQGSPFPAASAVPVGA